MEECDVMLRDYLKNFKGCVGEKAQRGVFNCLAIIKLLETTT